MLTPLSEAWIARQWALCEAATPGPWMLGWPGEQWPMARRCVTAAGKDIILTHTDEHGYYPGGIQEEADGAFIVAAREGYPVVLQKLKELLEKEKADADATE